MASGDFEGDLAFPQQSASPLPSGIPLCVGVARGARHLGERALYSRRCRSPSLYLPRMASRSSARFYLLLRFSGGGGSVGATFSVGRRSFLFLLGLSVEDFVDGIFFGKPEARSGLLINGLDFFSVRTLCNIQKIQISNHSLKNIFKIYFEN